ncbi:hypothetical protein NKJ81_19280 [Mesorhizobium sp. M0018]|uniref:hypothetical protein n=1 Tax=Mesorhizobium sp. M0018 TaxID=2956844 RepID=UPI0033393575
MIIKNLPKWLGATSMAVFLLASITPSHAESYSNLQSKGYKTGKLSRGASGSLGWFVSNGEKKYFCRMRAARAYIGTTGMVAFTAAGRQISLDREVYEKYAGFDASIPQLSDLKAGKLNKQAVGNCGPAK